MISLRAAILRELIRLYTYPYRKRHMSLSRSVKLKGVGFTPPRGLAEAGTGARYIKCEGMWHDYLYMFPKLKESREAWSEIKKFICSHIKI